MLLYVTLGTNDLQRAGAFYDTTLATLGRKRRKEDEVEIGYGADEDVRCRLWVVTPFDGKAATNGNGSMVALEAESRAAVDAFYAAALANGGTDEGAPGLRPFHPHFYAAYVRDPDGNKLSAVCERPGGAGRADEVGADQSTLT
ncbi:VOC family protein [Ensifer sp. LCM 4579]|uniref:VOC family protein n=1 Tax=Ensifer sp. LCM 4579 TaxID=1848292 RepID=UPI0008D96EE7|nr:VOC family protein [Ensifer sp. LCM 4579]OHV85474.1 glyoxalase [Ensifer sp. LCM 4579]